MVALSLGEIAYVDRPLYDYVQHGGAAIGHESKRRPREITRNSPLKVIRNPAMLRNARGRPPLRLSPRVSDPARGQGLGAAPPEARRKANRVEKAPPAAPPHAPGALPRRLGLALRAQAHQPRQDARQRALSARWPALARDDGRGQAAATSAAAPRARDSHRDAETPTGLGADPRHPPARDDRAAAARRLLRRAAAGQHRDPDDRPRVTSSAATSPSSTWRASWSSRECAYAWSSSTSPSIGPRTWRSRHRALRGTGRGHGHDRDRVRPRPVRAPCRSTRPTASSPPLGGRLTSPTAPHEDIGAERFVYLIQECEPLTFAMGSSAALARQTYDFPHYALFSTELLRDYFRLTGMGVFASNGAGEEESVAFENAITPVRPPTAEEMRDSERKLLFYARPERHAERNMFELGLFALAQARDEGVLDGWQLYGIGGQQPSEVRYGDGLRIKVLARQDQSQYADMLRGHAVGLSLMMTPHPSLVPLEMAAAGMPVVTNTFENKTAEALAEISDQPDRRRADDRGHQRGDPRGGRRVLRPRAAAARRRGALERQLGGVLQPRPGRAREGVHRAGVSDGDAYPLDWRARSKLRRRLRRSLAGRLTGRVADLAMSGAPEGARGGPRARRPGRRGPDPRGARARGLRRRRRTARRGAAPHPRVGAQRPRRPRLDGSGGPGAGRGDRRNRAAGRQVRQPQPRRRVRPARWPPTGCC